MKASEPKWVNSNEIQYEVNSLMLGDLQINYRTTQVSYILVKKLVLYIIHDSSEFLQKKTYILFLKE